MAAIAREIPDHGFVTALGRRLYFRSFGSAAKGTILCLHGGPGWTHNYLLPLADLSKFGFQVVLYDQLACGKSERPADPSIFTVDYAVEEVDRVRQGLRLGNIFLMGSSWGGMLALAYALKYQSHLRGLIISSGLASVPAAMKEMQRLKSQLPKRILRIIGRFEKTEDFENPEYLQAVEYFYRKHLCRVKTWPKEFVYSYDHLNRDIYYTMSGPNEFTCVGTLRDWDITDQLHMIRVPTLVTVGRHDEITPRIARAIHSRIEGSELVIFAKSSHTAMWEERAKYMRVVSGFMAARGLNI